MKKYILYFTIAVLATGCYFSPYPGYSRLNKDFYYKLIEIGENTIKPAPGNYITTHLRYCNLRDSIFFEGTRKFMLDDSGATGLFTQGIQLMSEGDSASFIISIQDFFGKTLQSEIPGFLDSEEYLIINVRILEIQTAENYLKEKDLFLEWVREFRLSEYDIIQKYLTENKIDIEPEPNGIYFLSYTKGEGPPVKKGKLVTIHYEGKFLNGKFVDSTRKRDVPLDFIYGQEMFLIEGLDYAVGQMNEGGRAVVLIPSGQAFGPSGSYKGIIPPFTALIYEIEVLNVK